MCDAYVFLGVYAAAAVVGAVIGWAAKGALDERDYWAGYGDGERAERGRKLRDMGIFVDVSDEELLESVRKDRK